MEQDSHVGPPAEQQPGLGGRTALVAGAGGGIGQEVCRALAAAGATVVGVDVARPGATEDAAYPGCTASLVGDITTDADRLVEQAVEVSGRLDAVVNLVGTQVFADLLAVTDDEWAGLIETNLSSAFRLSRAAAKHMGESGHGGTIVHFTSVTSLFGSPGQAPYAAAKAGLTNLVKSMAVEWAPMGIRVNAVSPVMTRTAINSAWLDAEPTRGPAIAAKIPLGRLGRPSDYAGLVRFLVSDDASFITGQTIYADGGASLVHPLLGVAQRSQS
ncbi:MAG: 2-deoxy-D-gluconate 3-dehydrogenase [Actinotalea sp.]|jgi:NAD(P)-dependent dehydrogenase (short-subunit alcohol dehydrogenase family)|nr:2-deoxy-D-gluconate 3-dehydrogenase [Actinotalea sp.]